MKKFEAKSLSRVKKNSENSYFFNFSLFENSLKIL